MNSNESLTTSWKNSHENFEYRLEYTTGSKKGIYANKAAKVGLRHSKKIVSERIMKQYWKEGMKLTKKEFEKYYPDKKVPTNLLISKFTQ